MTINVYPAMTQVAFSGQTRIRGEQKRIFSSVTHLGI